MLRAACRRVGWEGWVGGVGVDELMLLGARVVRSIVHVAGRVFVVLYRQVAVVVSGESGVVWCNNCFADLLWVFAWRDRAARASPLGRINNTARCGLAWSRF